MYQKLSSFWCPKSLLFRRGILMDSFLAVWQSGLILVLHSEQNHNLVVSR